MEIIVGAALDTLPRLADRGEMFDFVFIDADKENNSAYVQWAIELGRPGTVIVVDNIVRRAACSTRPPTTTRRRRCATCSR